MSPFSLALGGELHVAWFGGPLEWRELRDPLALDTLCANCFPEKEAALLKVVERGVLVVMEWRRRGEEK